MTQQINIRNPRTGKTDYIITPPTSEQLAEKSTRLRQAQIDWQQQGLSHRIETLQQWKQAILSHKDRLKQALITDTGRLSVSILEIDSFISSIDRWCRLAPDLLSEESKNTAIPFIRLQSQLVPYPLVGVISPWNFPLLLSTIDTIPALLAGCAVIVKPSEIAPRFIQPLLETIASVPNLRDVLTYIEGAGETGAALIDLVDLVCFTGSVATGKKVAEAAARRFIPAFLELGGKDPAIVLESANIELATSALLWGSVVNTGQSCLSIERIYVQESIIDNFVAKLTEKAERLQLAYPTIESGEIGPIIAERQAAIIQSHLDDAIQKGAKVNCGGMMEELEGGFWCRPTVLTQVNHSMKVMTEETFGPIMPIMSFSNIDEAIHLANDSIYGLSGAVFAGEEGEAMANAPAIAYALAQQINCGAISINDCGLTALIYEGEKNSFKYSGMGGSRMGDAGIKRFMRKKALLVKTQSIPDPWWFKIE
jgi:succinate-semialdehyde dehydrogenase / glutarate-semialdehyde dehydrogenase